MAIGNGAFAGGFAGGLAAVRERAQEDRNIALRESLADLERRKLEGEIQTGIKGELQGNLDRLTTLLTEGAGAFAGTREEFLASDYAQQVLGFAVPIATQLGMSPDMLTASIPATLGDQRKAETTADVGAASTALGRDLTPEETAGIVGLTTATAPLIVQLQDARDRALAAGNAMAAAEIDAQITRLGQGDGPAVVVNTGDRNADVANVKFSEAAGTSDAGRRDQLLALATTAPEATFTVQRLVDIISDPAFETGPATSALVDLQALAGTLGIDLNAASQGLFGKPADQLTKAQEFRRLANNLALDFVSKMKGALSDRELAFVQQGVAGLGSTTEANIAALATMLAAQEFIADRAAELRSIDNTREAFLAFETDIAARGVESLTTRAKEIEAMIAGQRAAAQTIDTASPEDLGAAILDALKAQ